MQAYYMSSCVCKRRRVLNEMMSGYAECSLYVVSVLAFVALAAFGVINTFRIY